jgi:copper chaperone CopZ
MKELYYKIGGMSCNHCVMAVKKELLKLNPESMDVEIGSVRVVIDETKIKSDFIEKAITDAGYKIIN